MCLILSKDRPSRHLINLSLPELRIRYILVRTIRAYPQYIMSELGVVRVGACDRI